MALWCRKCYSIEKRSKFLRGMKVSQLPPAKSRWLASGEKSALLAKLLLFSDTFASDQGYALVYPVAFRLVDFSYEREWGLQFHNSPACKNFSYFLQTPVRFIRTIVSPERSGAKTACLPIGALRAKAGVSDPIY